jgi:glycosyltransferase involved in cell wall biosynthesis
MEQASTRVAARHRPRRVMYFAYTNLAVYPPVDHSSRILAEDGWDVLMLSGGSDEARDLRFEPCPGRVVKEMRFEPPGIRQKLHYARFCFWVFFWALRWRPSWVYASDPFSSPVAFLLTWIPGIDLLYHEHDSPRPLDATGRPVAPLQRLIARARVAVARRATLCVLPQEQRLVRFRTETGRSGEILCVWNCPARDEVSTMQEHKATGRMQVAYHGSIVPGRPPRSVVEALAHLPEEVTLHIAGYETVGARGYVAELRELADRLGLGSRVHFAGPMSRRRLLTWARASHVGLSFMPSAETDPNIRNIVGASNKPFDYLACGQALLVSDEPEWVRVYVTPGYGRSCDPDNVTQLAAELQWFFDHPSERAQMATKGQARIQADWNYETRFAPVIDRMTKRLRINDEMYTST